MIEEYLLTTSDSMYNTHANGAYMTAEEIATDIVENDRVDLVDVFAFILPDTLVVLHHTLGRWIRNSYGLWSEEYGHNGEMHVDDYSFTVVQRLYKMYKENL